MIGPEPMCERCKHFDRDFTRTGFGYRCKAFPEGIPEEIYAKGFNHKKPYPGDRGIRFHPMEGP